MPGPKTARITYCLLITSGPAASGGLGPLPSGSEIYKGKELPPATNMSSLCNPLQHSPFMAFPGGEKPGIGSLFLASPSRPIINKKSSSISFLLPLPVNVSLILFPSTIRWRFPLFDPPFSFGFLFTIPGVPPRNPGRELPKPVNQFNYFRYNIFMVALKPLAAAL